MKKNIISINRVLIVPIKRGITPNKTRLKPHKMGIFACP